MATNSGHKAYIAVDPEVLFHLSAMSSSILASLAEPFASNGDVQELFCAVRIASENFHGGTVPSTMIQALFQAVLEHHLDCLLALSLRCAPRVLLEALLLEMLILSIWILALSKLAVF